MPKGSQFVNDEDRRPDPEKEARNELILITAVYVITSMVVLFTLSFIQ